MALSKTQSPVIVLGSQLAVSIATMFLILWAAFGDSVTSALVQSVLYAFVIVAVTVWMARRSRP